MSMEYKARMEERLFKLRTCVHLQTAPGNYDANDYMLGYANGLILAESIVTDRPAQFLTRSRETLFRKVVRRFSQPFALGARSALQPKPESRKS